MKLHTGTCLRNGRKLLGSIAGETAENRTEDIQNTYLERYSRTSHFGMVTSHT
jgi:hypothetical protein